MLNKQEREYSMNIWKRMSLSVAVAVMALLLFTMTIAFAEGAGAVTFTQVFHTAVQSFPTPNPCTGASAAVTLIYNGVFHTTALTSGKGAGTFWATGTQTGDFVLTPDDPTQPTYTGHLTAWFGDNNNLHNGVEGSTFTIHGVGSDGSTLDFHDVAHMSVNANGVTFSFDKPTCS